MKMKFVGLGNHLFIRTAIGREERFEQTTMTRDEFEGFMKQEYPGYFSEFVKSGSNDIADFFWNYGETEEMKIRGEAYVFTGSEDLRLQLKLRIREQLYNHLHETGQYRNLSVFGLLGFCVGYYGQIDAPTLEVVQEMLREGAVTL